MRSSFCLLASAFAATVLAAPLPPSPCPRSSLSRSQLQDLFNHRAITVSLSSSNPPHTVTIGHSTPASDILSSEQPLTTQRLLDLSHRESSEDNSPSRVTSSEAEERSEEEPTERQHNPAASAPTSALPALREWETQQMRACQLALEKGDSSNDWEVVSAPEGVRIGIVNIVVPGDVILLWCVGLFLLAVVLVEASAKAGKLRHGRTGVLVLQEAYPSSAPVSPVSPVSPTLPPPRYTDEKRTSPD